MRKAKPFMVDMDDVTFNFYKAAKGPNGEVLEERMFDKDFFLNLEPMPGAKSAIFQIMKMGFDVWILSQPLALLPESYMHKAQAVHLHFPQLVNKIILTQDKGLSLGHYLVDDNAKKWQQKFELNGGKFIHFPYGGYNLENMQDPETIWKNIVEQMKLENPYIE